MTIAGGKFEGPDKVASFRIFKMEVEALAAARQKNFDIYGLLAFVMTLQEWNLRPRNILAADPAAVPPILAGFRPMPTIPDLPDVPVLGAVHSAFTRYNIFMAARDSLIEDLFKLKQAILAALDEKDLALVSDPIDGTMSITHAGIMARLFRDYGRIQASDIDRWKTSLAANIEAGTTLAQRIGIHKRTTLLLRGVATVHDYDQIQSFKIAFATHAAVIACIERFEHDHPDPITRTFDQLADYLTLHSPPISTMAALGYSNSATNEDHAGDEPMQLAEALATIQRLKEAVPPARQTLRSGRGTGRTYHAGRTAGGRSSNAPNKKYCFVHGYCNHLGANCDVMASDMARDGGSYTNKNVTCASHLDDPAASKRNAPQS